VTRSRQDAARLERRALRVADGTADASGPVGRVLALQQTAGNRAVRAMLARSDDVGWKGPDVDPKSVNAEETSVKTDKGEVRRIPVQEIQEGHPKDLPLRKDDRSVHKGEKEARTNVDPGKESTTEAADSNALGRAIVLIPKRLKSVDNVEVLLFFHGHTIGFRQSAEDAKPADEDIYRIEQQLDASDRPMIAVLPQGDIKAHFWRAKKDGKDPSVFDVDRYIGEALGKVPARDWPGGKPPKDWSVVLSGHSGGGAALTALFGDSSKLPKHLEGLIEFDAVNQKEGGKVEEIGEGAEFNAIVAFLKKRLDDDLAKVRDERKRAGSRPEPEIRELQKQRLEREGFRFRGFHHGESKKGQKLNPEADADYNDRYELVRRGIEAWFAKNEKELGGKGQEPFETLRSHYSIESAGEGVQHMGVMGATLGKGLGGLPTP
jgi:hypothetical protein